MSIQVVSFTEDPGAGDLWAVYDSTTETMFSPVFHRKLDAVIFVATLNEKSIRRQVIFAGLSTQLQIITASVIHDFVESTFPLDQFNTPILPAGWADDLTESCEEAADYDFDNFLSNYERGLLPERLFLIKKLVAFEKSLLKFKRKG